MHVSTGIGLRVPGDTSHQRSFFAQGLDESANVLHSRACGPISGMQRIMLTKPGQGLTEMLRSVIDLETLLNRLWGRDERAHHPAGTVFHGRQGSQRESSPD